MDTKLKLRRTVAFGAVLGAVCLATAQAQDQGTWRRFDGPQGQQQYGPQGQQQYGPQNQQQYGPDQTPPPPAPATLSIAPGKYLTVRINNFLSSNRNQSGDGFTASLAEPLVVDGFVVARPGQLVNGRVVEALKAGRVKGTSSLRLELTELSLVDGQQIPLRTQLIQRRGDTSIGRDIVGAGATTAVGAAIGAGINGGVGAGVGAAAGLVLGTIGVLVTRGEPTVVYPETPLTFRVESPITISTTRAPGAFEPVSREDYEASTPRLRTRPGYAGGPPPPYPVAYGYPFYRPFWGPSFYFYSGPRFYGRYRRW